MALILALETSTSCGSVALLQDDKLIGYQYYNIDKSHSSLLHPMIDQLMKNCQFKLSELDAVAISEGPGSYTGLRIGTSAAKGLCFSLDIPLISINTLEAMAHQVKSMGNTFDLYCPMIDARRMEVYTLLLDTTSTIRLPTEPMILDESSFEKELEANKIAFFGDGAFKFKDIVDSSNAVFIDKVTPSAAEIAFLATRKYQEALFENVVSFEPFYLKEFRIIPSKKNYAGGNKK
ncbi:tRNA (adenosine(37)-N6)-threonylcarbamoyltransferase complex dimerization subunit type 1 TsaB [Reichenbachiella versicolor]|uniref:tRNA (adenosine(37)-N6)-threonylcarbamoyltransferase complex dimerization subunit type 1 TsaB n=1 Tax=Reichenbachiella versicolor TaxID=1821036 RepID=UPI000D6E9461|nr:tRNA (adenosine(37)-N6)-threonylcarbamoyltransferase complex dimerization subunit type 1 TsaB [Reichenbachiella versicolor]